MSDYLGFFKIDERGTTIWRDLTEMKKYIKGLQPGNYMVKITPYTENRSIDQNKYYWKLIEIISKEIGYETQEMHEVLKYKFLQKTIQDSNGNLVKGIKSTASLNTREFTEYINNIKFYIEQELSINLPKNF